MAGTGKCVVCGDPVSSRNQSVGFDICDKCSICPYCGDQSASFTLSRRECPKCKTQFASWTDLENQIITYLQKSAAATCVVCNQPVVNYRQALPGFRFVYLCDAHAHCPHCHSHTVSNPAGQLIGRYIGTEIEYDCNNCGAHYNSPDHLEQELVRQNNGRPLTTAPDPSTVGKIIRPCLVHGEETHGLHIEICQRHLKCPQCGAKQTGLKQGFYLTRDSSTNVVMAKCSICHHEWTNLSLLAGYILAADVPTTPGRYVPISDEQCMRLFGVEPQRTYKYFDHHLVVEPNSKETNWRVAKWQLRIRTEPTDIPDPKMTPLPNCFFAHDAQYRFYYLKPLADLEFAALDR